MADINPRSDFVVDTGSFCFLCLQLGPSCAAVEKGNEEVDTLLQLTSFQYFSRYLKMNLGKTFTENLTISADLVNKVEKEILKVWLCGECKIVTEKFSTLCALFEKVEIEMMDCLKVIFDKIKVGNVNGLEHFHNTNQEALKIAAVVRELAAEKCARRIKTDLPRVQLSSLNISKDLLEANRKSIAVSNRVHDDNELSPRSPMSTCGSIISVDDESTFSSENDSGNVAQQFSDSEPAETQSPDTRVESSEQFPENCETHSEREQQSQQIIQEEDKNENDQQIPSGNELGNGVPFIPNPGGTGMSYLVPINGVYMYKCSSCTMEFCTRPESHLHYKKIHLNFQFSCEYCKFACFGSEEELSEHFQTCPRKLAGSSGNSEHVCKICHKCFKNSQLLRVHVKYTHSGERKFACDMCTWKFKTSGNLRSHKKKVHFKK